MASSFPFSVYFNDFFTFIGRVMAVSFVAFMLIVVVSREQ